MIHDNRYKLLSVGASLGSTFVLTLVLFFPNLTKVLLFMYLMLSITGLYKMKDEFSEIIK